MVRRSARSGARSWRCFGADIVIEELADGSVLVNGDVVELLEPGKAAAPPQ
ncbi:MAG TPA: hypothetical protein VFR86_30810 [Burkholderiaceae bacterium]|nr:hypothetical protein [Burkholderiaceae bacterium]